jgi:uncharacterized C2H2 Zn-finger protein
MVREIITWCSPCFADEVREPGLTLVLAIDGGKPQALDLCEVHHKQIAQPLLDVLAEYGQPVDISEQKRSSKSAASVTSGRLEGGQECPVTTCGKSYRNAASLSKHVRRVHGTTITDVRHGSDQLDGMPDPEKTHKCPDDDCGRLFSTPQGLGAHRSRVHGYVSPNATKAAS